MNAPSFDSYAQNGEDVVLWRALHGVDQGRYVDVGANHPREDSVSMAFYERGWSGITVEPDPEFAGLQRAERPRDIQVEAAITTAPSDDETVTLHVVDGTGLSTLDDSYGDGYARAGRKTHDVKVRARRLDAILEEAGWAGLDIQFMSIDTEGSERPVLESVDLTVWRPWVLVVEATTPNTTESTRDAWEDIVVDAGYKFCLFDGLSCFYVADEHSDRLAPLLSYPACILDNYTNLAMRKTMAAVEGTTAALTECQHANAAAQQNLRELAQEVVRWRAEAISRWAASLADGPVTADLRRQRDALQAKLNELGAQHHATVQQLQAMYESTSWQVTKPLRTVSARLGHGRGGR